MSSPWQSPQPTPNLNGNASLTHGLIVRLDSLADQSNANMAKLPLHSSADWLILDTSVLGNIRGISCSQQG